MTDDENKRQRHLAEMMIAQCDGKTVQFKAKGDPWSDVSVLLSECDTERREFRIKPDYGVPPEVHESGWQWRPVSDDTAHAPPFGTIRKCSGCGCLVAGGPTACVRCAEVLND